MAYSLFWLLLPVAAASGWWVASAQQRKMQIRQKVLVPSDYYKGINYFLNEQPDKAIDVFIRMLDVDSETVEPHLALGNLFRRRGEIERAIRIHQNLIARPMLAKDQRAQALLELGHDYMHAGLFDRAESLLEELVARDGKNLPALRLLKTIYEQEKDWLNCIKVVRKIEAHSSQRLGSIAAQYYCEIAVENIKIGAFSEAKKILRRSLTKNSSCGRAMILQAEIEDRNGSYRSVIKVCRKILLLRPDYLIDVIEIMFSAYGKLGKTRELMAFIESVINDQTAIHAVLFYFDYLLEKKNTQVAMKFLEDYLLLNPSLKGLQRLLLLQQSMESMATDSPEIDGNRQKHLNIIAKLLENTPQFKCNNCGFSGIKRHWQCPGCHQWESISVVTGLVAGKEQHVTVGHC